MVSISIEGKHSNQKMCKAIVIYNCSRVDLSMCKRESDIRLLQWCLTDWPWSRDPINYCTIGRCASYIDGFIEAKNASSSSDEGNGNKNETFCSLIERLRENKMRVRILKERIKFKKRFFKKTNEKVKKQCENRKKSLLAIFVSDFVRYETVSF